ncbi:hypothetical protein DRP04_13185 [Archaeoglobales archaeon]|nr:MAG: hypothetical protein DRP04_13185 [Archaeoglobales archaeon]
MDYRGVAAEFKEEILRDLGSEIEAIILYGSVARGEENRESDIDIFVLVKNKRGEIYDRISRIRTRTDLKHSTLISLFVVDEKEFKEYMKLGSPFLTKVLREGVLLYGNEEFRKICKSIA